MNLIELRIKRTIDTSRYGAMSSGDILRTDADYARHLVDDLKVAVYIEPPAPPACKPRRIRKSRTREEQS